MTMQLLLLSLLAILFCSVAVGKETTLFGEYVTYSSRCEEDRSKFAVFVPFPGKPPCGKPYFHAESKEYLAWNMNIEMVDNYGPGPKLFSTFSKPLKSYAPKCVRPNYSFAKIMACYHLDAKDTAIKLRHFTDDKCTKKIEDKNFYFASSSKVVDINSLREQLHFFAVQAPWMLSTNVVATTSYYSLFRGDGTCQRVISVDQGKKQDIIYAQLTAPTHVQLQLSCGPGLYFDSTSQICIPCQPGTYSDGIVTIHQLQSDCKLCRAGTYSNVVGATSAATCIQCPYGTYQSVSGAQSMSDCQLCPAGSYSWSSGGIKCSLCPADTYSPDVGAKSDKTCVSCPKGYSSKEPGAKDLAECSLCARGMYYNDGTGVCTPCPIGTYYPRPREIQSADSCIHCYEGSYSNITGAPTCFACPVGTYGGAKGATSLSDCLLCPAGTFSSKVGSKNCDQCPSGKYGVTVGGSSQNVCESCPPGMFANNYGSTACQRCPVNECTYSRKEKILKCLTPLPFLSSDTFHDCAAALHEDIQELDLRGLGLKSLPNGLFDSLVNLSVLRLSDNQLQGLPLGIFDKLTRLTQLHLSHNKLTIFPEDGVFDKLLELRWLDLSYNALQTMPTTSSRSLHFFNPNRDKSVFYIFEVGHNPITANIPVMAELDAYLTPMKVRFQYSDPIVIADFYNENISIIKTPTVVTAKSVIGDIIEFLWISRNNKCLVQTSNFDSCVVNCVSHEPDTMNSKPTYLQLRPYHLPTTTNTQQQALISVFKDDKYRNNYHRTSCDLGQELGYDVFGETVKFRVLSLDVSNMASNWPFGYIDRTSKIGLSLPSHTTGKLIVTFRTDVYNNVLRPRPGDPPAVPKNVAVGCDSITNEFKLVVLVGLQAFSTDIESTGDFSCATVFPICDMGSNRVFKMEPACFCPLNTYSDVNSDGSSTSECLPCKLGTSSKSIGASSCNPCAPGTYFSDEQGCARCPVNTYSDTESALRCIACPVRTTTLTTGATSVSDCIPCAPGTYFSDEQGCAKCPVNTYSDTKSALSCTACPARTATVSTGATSVSDCIPCTPGTYFSDEQGCTKCPVNTYSDTKSALSCNSCPIGSFSKITGATSVSDCVPCAPGTFYSPEKGCSSCPLGTFSNTKSALSCTPSPAGYYAKNVGTTGCLMCPPGSYSLSPASGSCQRCAKNTYSDKVASSSISSCVACPLGTFTLKHGARGVKGCMTDEDIPAYFKCPITGNLFVEKGEILISQVNYISYSAEGLKRKLPAGLKGTPSLRNLYLETAVNSYINDPCLFREKFKVFVNETGYEVDSTVPEFFSCPINLGLLREPVVSVSGNTYSKEMILKWLKKTPTDPLTRKDLKAEQLIPNKALEAAIADSVITVVKPTVRTKSIHEKVSIRGGEAVRLRLN